MIETETLDATPQRVSAARPARIDVPGISNVAARPAMSLPTAVFLDTSALAGQRYNVDSTAMRAFIRVARERKLKLLIPDPMEIEVRRQTNELIGDLLTALDIARRKAPFLAGWSELSRLGRLGKNAAENIGLFAWSQFLGMLETEKLLCSTIATANIISEYQEGASIMPGRGEKRRRTSDALCVAILRDYSARNKCVTAVISEDPDFKGECDGISDLMHLHSISALTELFLADRAEIEQIKASVLRSVHLLEERARQEVSEMPFVHENRSYRVERSDIRHVAIVDPRIVSIDSTECTVTFVVEVRATHQLRSQMHRDDGRGEISEISESSGTVRLTLAPETQRIESISSFELDDTALYILSGLCRAPC
jgi:indole-3-glycerol phosphate synthase